MSASAVLQYFRDNTKLSKLPDQDLWKLSMMSETAEGEMRNLAELMRGIGCLVGTDGYAENICRSGSFQNSSEVSSLLFSLSDTLQSQIEALCIASNADVILNERKKKKGASHEE